MSELKIIFCCTGAAYHNMLHGISYNVETKIIEVLLVGGSIHDTHRYSDCWWTKVTVSLLCLYTSPFQLPSMSFDSFSQDPRTYVIAHYITSMKDVSGFKLQHSGVCSTLGSSHINQIHPEYAGYKCFVSLVTKQMTSTWLLPCMTSCKCILLASQFKSSLAAVAGFVALFTHCQAIQLQWWQNLSS